MPEKEFSFLSAFRRPLLSSLAITCLYFLLGWMFFIPFSQTGDDTVVNWITRGIGMVDKPSEFLLVVNIVLGILLKNLNLVFPRIPWFGLGLYSVFFFSVWALLAAFLSRERSPWAGFLFAVLGTPLFFHCYAWPQYTVYCLLAAQAGIFLLANPVRPYSFGFGLSAFLLVTASLIRLEPALFSLAAGAVYLLRSFRMEPETRINRNRLRVLSAVAILIVLCSGFNWFYASAHDGWKEAREYYDLRFSIGESKVSSYEHQAQAFQSVGWSPEDYRMFLSAFYALPTFNLENLKKLDGLLKVDFEVKRAVLSEMLKPTVVQFMLWSFGVCFVFGLMGKGKAWGSVSWVVLLVLFLVSYNKIVARVFWPQLLFADLLLVFLLPPGGFFPGKSNLRHLLPMALALFLGWGAVRTIGEDYSINRMGPAVRQAFQESLKALSPRPNQLFIIWGPSFPFAGFPLFQTDDSLKGFRIFWLSWLERTPYGGERLAQFHIHDFLKDTLDRADIYWLLSDSQNSSLEDYYRKREGIAVSRKLVFRGYFDVYQMVTQK